MDELPLNISFAICHRSELCADNKVKIDKLIYECVSEGLFTAIDKSFRFAYPNNTNISFQCCISAY
jgi:hypothetical protein